MKKNVFIYFILIVLCGCSKTDSKTGNYLTINVSLDNYRKILFEEWFDTVEIIPLETSDQSIFGDCRKLLYHNEKFFIHDFRQHSIFVFNSSGKFLNSTLLKQGDGPEEYRSITDFDIDKKTNNIELLDASAYNIKIYDENFNFIKSISLPKELLPLGRFKKISDDLYVFYRRALDKTTKTLVFYSIQTNEIVKKICPMPSKSGKLVSVEKNPFYSFNNQTYFTHTFSCNDLFFINLEKLSIEKTIEYNLGKHTFKMEKLPNNKEDIFYSRFDLVNDKYAFIVSKCENANYYFAFILYNGNVYVSRYDKQTQEIDIINNKFTDGGMLLPPQFIDNDYFYIVVEAESVNWMINNQVVNSKSKEILSNLTADNNNVVLKYKFR